MSSYTPVQTRLDSPADGTIPRIDFDLREHKVAIAITWSILFITSGVLPIVLYFTLRYAAHLQLSTVLAVTTAIFGAVTLFSLSKRTWDLTKATSTCRPLGASRKALDYFHWNYMGGFAAVTAIIVAGNVTKNVRIVTLGLPILLVDVCSQLLIVGVLTALGMAAPFRISSVNKGERLRGGVYAIVEDIVAVDGGQGQRFREQLQARYLASKGVRSLCLQLDFLWGVTGLAAAAVAFGLIFGIDDANVGYTLGWAIPWGYAAFMALVTMVWVKAALKKERRSMFNGHVNAMRK